MWNLAVFSTEDSNSLTSTLFCRNTVVFQVNSIFIVRRAVVHIIIISLWNYFLKNTIFKKKLSEKVWSLSQSIIPLANTCLWFCADFMVAIISWLLWSNHGSGFILNKCKQLSLPLAKNTKHQKWTAGWLCVCEMTIAVKKVNTCSLQ